MKTKASILFFVVLLIAGCSHSSGHEHQDDTHDHTSDTHKHDQDDTKLEASLSLNNGSRWKVNETMMPFVTKMEKDIYGINPESVEDAKLLAETLQQRIDSLTSNCTMDGQAHEELHKWLLPHIELVKALSEANSLEASATIQEDLKQSMKTFEQYFE